jgi:hypothetical protein
MLDSIRDHAHLIGDQARELAEHLNDADATSVPPILIARALCDLEEIRANLARVGSAVMIHAQPRSLAP